MNIMDNKWLLFEFSKMPIFQSGVSSAKNNPLLPFQICGELHNFETAMMQ
jgi:hypothetical protein